MDQTKNSSVMKERIIDYLVVNYEGRPLDYYVIKNTVLPYHPMFFDSIAQSAIENPDTDLFRTVNVRQRERTR